MQPVRNRNGSKGLEVDTGQLDAACDQSFAGAVCVETINPLLELHLSSAQVREFQPGFEAVIQSGRAFVVGADRFDHEYDIGGGQEVGLIMAE